MIINALLFDPDGTVSRRRIDNRALAPFQEAVGGSIEAVTAPDWTAFVHEEGKLIDLPHNATAEHFLAANGWSGAGHDFLVGPVLVTGPTDPDGWSTSLSEALLAAAPPEPIAEGQEAWLRVTVARSNNKQALIEITTMDEGPYSMRVPRESIETASPDSRLSGHRDRISS